MKYQLNIMKNLFLSKYYKLILFYLVFYLLMYVILKVQYPVFNVSNFITMIGFIDIYNTSFLEIIYFVLEVTMIIYSLYLYFSYEEDRIKIKAKYKKEVVPDFIFDFEVTEEENEDKIVKRKKVDVKPMDEEEAILQMELLGHDFYVFNNIDEECISVLYRRKDGNYGIINTK